MNNSPLDMSSSDYPGNGFIFGVATGSTGTWTIHLWYRNREAARAAGFKLRQSGYEYAICRHHGNK